MAPLLLGLLGCRVPLNGPMAAGYSGTLSELGALGHPRPTFAPLPAPPLHWLFRGELELPLENHRFPLDCESCCGPRKTTHWGLHSARFDFHSAPLDLHWPKAAHQSPPFIYIALPFAAPVLQLDLRDAPWNGCIKTASATNNMLDWSWDDPLASCAMIHPMAALRP